MAQGRKGTVGSGSRARDRLTMAAKPPAIVAELGRPETPEETAARKAETSRRHRSNQTTLNLVVATIASLAIVLILVIVVVRPAPPAAEPIDFATIAAQAQPGADAPLVVPVLPETWAANSARFGNRTQVPTWYIGFITPSQQFIAFNQGIGANLSWEDEVLQRAEATGTATIDGLTWTVFDQRDRSGTGNYAYSMSVTTNDSTIVLHGTAPVEEFDLLAAAIAAEVSSP